MSAASTAAPPRPSASISLSASQLSDITTALQSVQAHFQSLSQSLSLVTSVFLQLSVAQRTTEQQAGRRVEDRAEDEAEEEADAEAAQPAKSDVECDEADESGDVDAEERRRDDSGIARALAEEQKRAEQPEVLQWSRSPAAVYSVNSKPANVWRKAAQLSAPQPTAAAAASSAGLASSHSPTRTRSPLSAEPASFSPRTPPLTSSIVALPPLAAAAMSRNAAIPPLFPSAVAHQPRVPQLSDARRKSTGSDGGDEEESKRNTQQTAAQPLSSSFLSSSSSASNTAPAVTAASMKRATTPLAMAAHVPALHFTTAAVAGEGRAGRTGSDSSAPAVSSPRSSRPSSASVLRPLRTAAAGLDDMAEDESLPPHAVPAFHSAPHAFASSTPTSPASRHIFLSQPNKVKLNVGGTVFHTTLSTLTSPVASSSMLHSIFSSQHFPLELDSKGAYFLDRDPSLFRLILNFLRDGSLSLSTLSPHTKQSLLREARYFALEPLVVSLQAELRQTQARLRRELSQEKEYRLVTAVEEKELAALFQRMTMMEGYDFEDWIMAAAGAAAGAPPVASSRGGSGAGIGGSRDREKERAGGGCVHVLFSKKLSRGELMLLDRLQTGM